MRSGKKKRAVTGGVAATLVFLGIVSFARAYAPQGRYRINADTVVDTATGLTWQRAAASSTYSWEAAGTYCMGVIIGGTGGWRLPRKLELESLVDATTVGPAIDTIAFPGTPTTSFWSSSPSAWNSDFAWKWYVEFDGGGSYVNNPSASYSVRCVH